LYQFIGRKIEITVGLYADRLGYGPAAVERKLSAIFEALSLARYLNKPWQGASVRRSLAKEIMKLEKDAHREFGRLVKHIEYVDRPVVLFTHPFHALTAFVHVP
jgi:DNA-binding transcriptional ArsR family regulator